MLKPSGRAPWWLNEQRLFKSISSLQDTSFRNFPYDDIRCEAERLRDKHAERLRTLAITGSGTSEIEGDG